jgi:hypothetical protein
MTDSYVRFRPEYCSCEEEVLFYNAYKCDVYLIELLTEMSARNLPVCKMRPTHKANNFTDICEPVI